MFTELLQQHFVHTALLAGVVVAILSGAIGVFVVTRGPELRRARDLGARLHRRRRRAGRSGSTR